MSEKATRVLALILVGYIVVAAVISFVAMTIVPIVSAVLLAIVFLWIVRVSRRGAQDGAEQTPHRDPEHICAPGEEQAEQEAQSKKNGSAQ